MYARATTDSQGRNLRHADGLSLFEMSGNSSACLAPFDEKWEHREGLSAFCNDVASRFAEINRTEAK